MRIIRFRAPSGAVRTGRFDGDGVHFGGERYALDEVDVLPPCEPTKIVCQAGGYQAHRDESGMDAPDRPELFLKAPNALAGHGDTVPIPGDKQVDFEAEFAVVVDSQCRNVAVEDAMDVVRGFTCANDLSNRDDQDAERNWVRGKAFDGALPVGPVVATPDEVPADATLEIRVNGETRQSATRDMMIFTVAELVAEVSAYMTLEPGDLVVTGTPEGPGPLSDGDEVEVEFEGVGTLSHTVVTE
jgi:2-keto-4-pentenoate hydratase/2-oxohepta-3-ene-1,7-dioic acid hydratase in catechol pathway